MSNVNTPLEHPLNAWELPPNGGVPHHSLQRTILQNDLLLLTPCVNLLWHQFRLRVSSQAHFDTHDVRETLTDIWQVRSKDIATYHLNDFGITNCTAMLQTIEQQEVLVDPVLLIQDEWRKSIFLLTQSFQDALETFYS